MMGELYHVCILQVNLCVQGQTNAVSLHTANHLDYRLLCCWMRKDGEHLVLAAGVHSRNGCPHHVLVPGVWQT